MILRKIVSCDHLYPTTIFKLLLGKSIISSFLEKFVNMKNMGTNDFEIFYRSDSKIVNSKKNSYLLNLLNCKNFLKINNWFKYNIINFNNKDKDLKIIFDEKQDLLTGPFLADKFIVFYYSPEKLMLVFTYFPIHILEKKNGLSDDIVRELKSYVYDNVSKESFDEMVSSKIDKEIDIETLESPKSITARYSTNRNKIMKISNVFGNFNWSVVFKKSNKNNETKEEC